MEMISTEISDVKIFIPKVFGDARGFFLESYNERVLSELLGQKLQFVQDNHSRSGKNVLRGLHFQKEHAQGKLVRVATGEVFDVAVDLRKDSPTYKKWVGMHLSEENQHIAWIPPGFAHGFLVLSDQADLLYKVTDFYHQPSDCALAWNDPEIQIAWPLEEEPLLSEKDARAKSFRELERIL